MTWLQRYRLRRYLRDSIWIAPVVGIFLALAAVRAVHAIDDWFGWRSELTAENARTVLGTLAGAMFSFTVFVCSSLLLVVQLATAQLTPRIIGSMFRDPLTKLSLAAFVFSFAFTMGALARIESNVPALLTSIATYSCIASLIVFMFLIDHVGKLLRPSGVFRAVALAAHHVIKNVYPRRHSDPKAPAAAAGESMDGKPLRVVTSRSGGVVLAFDVRGLVAMAVRRNCAIELVPQVGDFVAPGDPLFRIRGDVPESLLSDRVLRDSIALGTERTMEQDPAFAFRVIVDVASKGLSPAINDPTTAVLAIDQIHHLLRHVGGRRLDDERVRDASGRVRLIYSTPDWEDFVVLAVTEIRQFGGTSIQIFRRLRAMLEDLMRTLPAERAKPLLVELDLLNRSAERFFKDPEDRVRAGIGDPQGIGGRHGSNGAAGVEPTTSRR